MKRSGVIVEKFELLKETNLGVARALLTPYMYNGTGSILNRCKGKELAIVQWTRAGGGNRA